MPRVIHFDIGAENPERAIGFYTNVFGWTIKKWDGPMDYWLVGTGSDTEPGINGGLSKRMSPMKEEGVHGFMCTVGVKGIDAYTEKVLSAGGIITMPKTYIPGVGWFVACKDTDGNAFRMMESDAKSGM
jgi:uncharacterized protein